MKNKNSFFEAAGFGHGFSIQCTPSPGRHYSQPTFVIKWLCVVPPVYSLWWWSVFQTFMLCAAAVCASLCYTGYEPSSYLAVLRIMICITMQEGLLRCGVW